MKNSARVENSFRRHLATLNTSDTARELKIPPKADGIGSSANGGELVLTLWDRGLTLSDRGVRQATDAETRGR